MGIHPPFISLQPPYIKKSKKESMDNITPLVLILVALGSVGPIWDEG